MIEKLEVNKFSKSWIITKRQHSSFGLSADFITEYQEQTVNEVQVLGANDLKIMVSLAAKGSSKQVKIVNR